MIAGKNISVKDSVFEYYNAQTDIPMFEGINIDMHNISYKVLNENGGRYVIHGLGGLLNIYDSIFEVHRFAQLFNLYNQTAYIENTYFYENYDDTGYRYMIRLDSNADYKSSISMINCYLLNRKQNGVSTNCYVFTCVEGGLNYKLNVMRLIGNYYNLSNLNSKSYAGGTNEEYNLLINVNNSKYNAS